MTEYEWKVNQGLRSLDEAYRLQRIERAVYRQRRRQLLAGLSDAVRGAAVQALAPTPAMLSPAMFARSRHVSRSEPPGRESFVRRHGIALLMSLVLLALLACCAVLGAGTL